MSAAEMVTRIVVMATKMIKIVTEKMVDKRFLFLHGLEKLDGEVKFEKWIFIGKSFIIFTKGMISNIIRNTPLNHTIFLNPGISSL